MDVRIDCGGYNERGKMVTCRALTTWDGKTASKLDDWRSGSNSRWGWNSVGSYWAGRAIKSKGASVNIKVELDDTLILNRTQRKIQIHPRSEWSLGPGMPATGSPKKHGDKWLAGNDMGRLPWRDREAGGLQPRHHQRLRPVGG